MAPDLFFVLFICVFFFAIAVGTYVFRDFQYWYRSSFSVFVHIPDAVNCHFIAQLSILFW